jgi:hypothetical protein
MQSVNLENWSYCRFEKGNLKAFISFGADPESAEMDLFNYFVTVLDDQELEIFQRSFKSLSEACIYLNSKYKDWDYVNQLAPKSGCSTCAAH